VNLKFFFFFFYFFARGGGAPAPGGGGGGGGGGADEFCGDPTVGPRPKVWTRGQKWKK